MKAFATLSFAIVLLIGSTVCARAFVPATFSLPIARAPHPLPLDASLRDPAWLAGALPGGAWANVTTLRPSAQETRAYVLYDDANLYVAFFAQQREAIVATQSTNDVGFGTDDFVGVGIDTSGSGSQAYFFETTPRGVRYEQATENVRYRPNWHAAAAVERDGWRAVMIIPLASMRMRPTVAQQWRINFFRSVTARAEHITWAFDPTMQDQPQGSWPSFGDVRFWPVTSGVRLTGAPLRMPKPRLEVYSLLSDGGDRNEYQQADGSFRMQRTRWAGADVSVPLTPTVNFVGTIDPDFSNVEIDQQTIVPQEFPRQLSEYRPFFAQGAQYINANSSGFNTFNGPHDKLFYSPAIGPFDRGAKVEGTNGLERFGVLSFRGYDQTTGQEFDDQAWGFKHALPDLRFGYWTDGVLAHHSLSGNDSSYEAGTQIFNPRSGFTWLANAAFDRDGTHTYAHALHSYVYLDRPYFQAILQYGDISPNFAPIDGFTSINDVRGFAGFVTFNGTTPGALKTWNIFLLGDRLLAHAGPVHQADSQILLNATLRSGLSFNGVGPTVSELLSNGKIVLFNTMSVPVGFGDGTSHPIDVVAQWGNFGGNSLHLYTLQGSRPFGRRYNLGFEYDGSYERNLRSGMLQSQWLRRISVGLNMGPAANLTFSLRGINGLGGFSPKEGLNLSTALHVVMQNGDLYLNFGSPSSYRTLNRTILKYVFRAGSDAGT